MAGFAAALVGALAVAGPPKAIVLMLGDDYGYNNVGFAHGPLAAGNPEMRLRSQAQPSVTLHSNMSAAFLDYR